MRGRRTILISAFALFLMPGMAAANQQVPATLHGTWEVDIPASVANMDGVVALDTMNQDELRSVLEKQTTPYTLKFDSTSLTARRGSQQLEFECLTRYRGPAVLYLGCHANNQPVTLTILEIGDGIRLLSSGTNDTDIYVWRRAGTTAATWTPWLNRDNPSGNGDYESLADFVKRGQACQEPQDVQCRSRRDGRSWEDTGQTVTCDTTRGAVCVNAEQSDLRCLDYEVRFLCP